MENYKIRQNLKVDIINNLNDIYEYTTEILNYLDGKEVNDVDELLAYFSNVPGLCKYIQKLLEKIENEYMKEMINNE